MLDLDAGTGTTAATPWVAGFACSDVALSSRSPRASGRHEPHPCLPPARQLLHRLPASSGGPAETIAKQLQNERKACRDGEKRASLAWCGRDPAPADAFGPTCSGRRAQAGARGPPAGTEALRVADLGAGIVDVSCGREPAAAGREVTLLERRGGGVARTRFANPGVVVPVHVAPWAALRRPDEAHCVATR